jgi:hypothetical protein
MRCVRRDGADEELFVMLSILVSDARRIMGHPPQLGVNYRGSVSPWRSAYMLAPMRLDTPILA